MQVDFEKQTIKHTCVICGKSGEVSFDDFKKNRFSVAICEHPTAYNMECFVYNLCRHDEPKAMQADPKIWQNNRDLHILKRILKHEKDYEEVKDEPDLYEKVHQKIGKEKFADVWRVHEEGAKHMREYLD